MSSPEFIAAPDVVVLDLQARTGVDAIRALHQRLSIATDAVVNPPKFLKGLLDRSFASPVCIAEDIALPHARTDAVSRLVLAVGRSEEGIAFDAAHPRVRLVFLIGTLRDSATEYLRVAAGISRLLRHGLTRAALFAAHNENEFRAVFSGGLAAPR